MNVANKDLCKELYELSGWGKQGDVMYSWIKYSLKDNPDTYPWPYPLINNMSELQLATANGEQEYSYPAYDLGYLLRKLPQDIQEHYLTLEICTAHGKPEWSADYIKFDSMKLEISYLLSDDNADITHADTPEDAACRLAIELIKQGVIKV